MWIPVVIVALAIAMVVGPILLIQPSKRQKRQSRLRNYAIHKGFRVQLLPFPENLDAVKSGDLIPVYTLPWETSSKRQASWLLIKRPFSHETHFYGTWQWHCPQPASAEWHQPLQQVLSTLPDSFIALGNGPQGIFVFWLERGGEELINVAYEQLSELMRNDSAESSS